MFFKARTTEATINRVRRAARAALVHRFEEEIDDWMHGPAADPSVLAARLLTILDEVAAFS